MDTIKEIKPDPSLSWKTYADYRQTVSDRFRECGGRGMVGGMLYPEEAINEYIAYRDNAENPMDFSHWANAIYFRKK